MENELKSEFLYDMHKVIYLAKRYPDKTTGDLAEMFEISILDFNAALWRAQDRGFIRVEVDESKKEAEKKLSVIKTPKEWKFGPDIEHLMQLLNYAIRRLNEQAQSDLEEGELGMWLMGYTSQDRFIAQNWLVEESKTLATYEVKDVDSDEKGKEISSTYTFYTLRENLDKQFGRQQFKNKKALK